MSKIIIGTGKLGRVIPHSYKKSLIDILGQALEKGLDVHVSPSYGNSLKEIRRNFYPLSQFTSKVIVKVDATYSKYLDYQIEITKQILGINEPIEVQLTGNIGSVKSKNFFEIKNKISTLLDEQIVDFFYFTPIFSNSNKFQAFVEKKNIGFCVHHSLIEREHTNEFFEETAENPNIRVIALRAFGESLNNYGNWHYPIFLEKKPDEVKDMQTKEHHKLCKNLSMTNAETRLSYILNHPKIYKGIFTFSNQIQFEEALKINNQVLDNETWNKLNNYSFVFSNYGRPCIGSDEPPNINFIYLHNFYFSLKTAIKTNLFSFFLRNIPQRLLTYIIAKVISARNIYRNYRNG